MGELAELGGDGLADPPFPGVALQHEEDVDEVLADLAGEDLDELGEVADSAELYFVVGVLQHVIEARE